MAQDQPRGWGPAPPVPEDAPEESNLSCCSSFPASCKSILYHQQQQLRRIHLPPRIKAPSLSWSSSKTSCRPDVSTKFMRWAGRGTFLRALFLSSCSTITCSRLSAASYRQLSSLLLPKLHDETQGGRCSSGSSRRSAGPFTSMLCFSIINSSLRESSSPLTYGGERALFC